MNNEYRVLARDIWREQGLAVKQRVPQVQWTSQTPARVSSGQGIGQFGDVDIGAREGVPGQTFPQLQPTLGRLLVDKGVTQPPLVDTAHHQPKGWCKGQHSVDGFTGPVRPKRLHPGRELDDGATDPGGRT